MHRGTSFREINMNARLLVTAAGIVSLAAAQALAAPLNPGVTLFRNGEGQPIYTSGPAPQSGGLLASTSSSISHIGSGILAGTVESFVWDADAGDGIQLVFGYRITLSETTNRDLVRVTFDGPWSGWQILDAGADSSGSTSHALMGDPRTLFRGNTGNRSPAAEFFIDAPGAGDPLHAGQQSAIIWFHTNATQWGTGTAGLSNSGTVGIASILVPIPLPHAGAMGLAGLAMLATARRRR
jgi:hypothetical protein